MVSLPSTENKKKNKKTSQLQSDKTDEDVMMCLEAKVNKKGEHISFDLRLPGHI